MRRFLIAGLLVAGCAPCRRLARQVSQSQVGSGVVVSKRWADAADEWHCWHEGWGVEGG